MNKCFEDLFNQLAHLGSGVYILCDIKKSKFLGIFPKQIKEPVARVEAVILKSNSSEKLFITLSECKTGKPTYKLVWNFNYKLDQVKPYIGIYEHEIDGFADIYDEEMFTESVSKFIENSVVELLNGRYLFKPEVFYKSRHKSSLYTFW